MVLLPVGERVAGGIVTASPPEWVRAAAPQIEPDYVDLFTMTTPLEETAEGWARAFFGDVPSPSEWLIWRAVLGLGLASGPSPETIAGWRVGAREPAWIRLDTGSRALTCHLIVRVDDGSVMLATLLRYDRPLRGLQWRILSTVHRALVPRIFADAEAALRENAGPPGGSDHRS
ncbi:hypothetical protein [Brevibacterium album]|uniref:hypothetical protein n=1 Tax=Brevibacterium album TaxID=417948 RepID=UPI001B7F811A|nr:hypothetical protein [Brevibacterium album]